MKPIALRFASLMTLLTLVTISIGCTGPLLTGMYLLGYGDTQAEYKGLKGKNVAVVCRPLVEQQYSNMNASKMIAREVAKRLRQNVSRIKIVNSQKVDEWLDANAGDDYVEIGRAFNADVVVGIDLFGFNLYEGQTLYRGTANYELKVIDCETGDVVFEKPPVHSVWPPNTGVPTSEKNEAQFRRQYVGKLADEISRTFHSHDHRTTFASDAAAFD
ncbi:MAG: hypothetical protein GX621_04805 [Pirellulaceae bacterium]|nr:hypothetical protein [Pirellulaceae bacterium]